MVRLENLGMKHNKARDARHESSTHIRVNLSIRCVTGLSAWQVTASVLMVSIGFVIYYLVPYAFIFANIPLFLTILNTILLGTPPSSDACKLSCRSSQRVNRLSTCVMLGMLFGASTLAAILQPALEKRSTLM